MEKLDRIFMVPYPCVWSDVGSWTRFDAALAKDKSNNYVCGSAYIVDSSNCSIFGDEIVALGVENLVIIKAQGKTFICSKDKADELVKLKAKEIVF